MIKISLPYFTDKQLKKIAEYFDDYLNENFNFDYYISEIPRTDNKIEIITSISDVNKSCINIYNKEMFEQMFKDVNGESLLYNIAMDIAGKWNSYWCECEAKEVKKLNNDIKEELNIDIISPEELYRILSNKFIDIINKSPKDKEYKDFLIILHPKSFEKLITFFQNHNESILQHMNNNLILLYPSNELLNFTINEYIDGVGYIVDKEQIKFI